MKHMIKNKYVILVFLLGILLLIRLPVLYTSIYKVYDGQELYIGTVAKELIESPILPLFDYQSHHNKGGTLVAGILAVPFFLLFGQSYFSLKLLAVSFSAATIVLWYLFLARFFNKRVALFAGLLFILSPPFYSKFTLMAYGKHTESNLFTIMAIYIFFRIFFDKEATLDVSNTSENKKTYYVLFGLISGFGIYFDYIFFLTLFTCFLFWFIFDKRFMVRKSFLVFAVSFLAGLAPWIYYNATHSFKGICVRDVEPDLGPPLRELFLPQSPLKALNKLITLLTRHVPNSFCFESFKNIPGHLISNSYYLIFVISFCLLVWLNRKIILRLFLGIFSHGKTSLLAGPVSREVFILAYLVVFLLLYSLGPYSIKLIEHELYNFYGYKRLIVLYPFIFVIISLFLDKLWSQKSRLLLFISLLLTLFFLTSGSAANYGLVTLDNFGSPFIYEGYSYYSLGFVIGKRSESDISKAVYLANKVKKQYRPLVFEGIGTYWGQMFYQRQMLNEYVSSMRQSGPEYVSYAIRGLGLSLGSECRDDIQRASDSINLIDQEYRPYAYEGLGGWVGLIYGHRADLLVKEISQVTKQYQSNCYLGAGVMVGSKFGQNIAYCVGLSEKIDLEYRRYYFEGLAKHLGWRYKYYLKRDFSDLIKQIPERYQPFFISGLQEVE